MSVPATAEEATKMVAQEEKENELMPTEELDATDGTGAKLAKVEVKTGEEDEEVMFKTKVKAFRFDEGENEWKERAVGELCLLRHKETKKTRLMLRQDLILKIRVVVNLSECGPMREHAGNEKAMVFTGMDYSDDEDATRETICFRFTSKDACKDFREKFVEFGGPQ